MSAAKVELVRSVYENFGKGDFPAALAVLDPDVEWIESDLGFRPHWGTHRGPEGWRRASAKVPEHFSEFAVIPVTLHDAPAAWVWTVRDGRVVHNMNYHDNEPWREALVGTD